MTFEQLITTVREWQSRMTPEQARAATEELAGRTVLGFADGLIIGTLSGDALWAYAAGDKPAEQADPLAFLRKPDPPPPRKRASRRRLRKPEVNAANSQTAPAVSPPEPPPPCTPKPARVGRPKVAMRARALVREQLKHGPRPEAHVMAAADAASIPERSLIVAADALGVRTQRGQWWLPG